MNALSQSFSAALICMFSTLVFAQAPIVRQSPPPSDQQQYQPAAQPDQQVTPPNYDQMAQQGQPAPEPLPPQQLDGIVNRIALYPDPLLAQVLTASTYGDEIPDADAWADQHSYLHGDALNNAMLADNLPWDPSVLALLPFPSVLDGMARDPDWTSQLGNAVLVQNADVMDAVQRLRREARGYGYLASNSDLDVIDDGGYVEIQPFDPYLYYVPIYDPLIVFGRPRPGLFIGGVIHFGPPITLGISFGRFGWFGAGFGWREHSLLVDHRPWTRTYANRNVYVHPYARAYVRPAAPRVEQHPAPANRPGPSRPNPPSRTRR